MHLLIARFDGWLLTILLLECSTMLQHLEHVMVPCGYFHQESSLIAVQPPCLANVFQEICRWPRNLSAYYFDEARGNHSSGRDSFRDEKQRDAPGCPYPCHTSDGPGGEKIRACDLPQWRGSAPLVSHAAGGSCPARFCQPGACATGRRCRRLQRVPWTVDTTPNAKGQAKRNRLRYPDLRADPAGGSTHILHGEGGGSQHDLLMSKNQRSEGRGRGKRSVFYQILISLVVHYFLFLGDHPGHVALRERLLGPLPECEEPYKKLGSHFQLQWVELSNSAKLSSRSNKACRCKQTAKFSSKGESGGYPHWLFSANFRAPSTRLWVAPATAFLPSVTPRDFSFLDHLGYRLASLAALPASCSLSRVRVAEAGFHFNPSTHGGAVQCHRCSAVYSLEQPAGAPGPGEFHVSASPACPVVRMMAHRHRVPDIPASRTASGGSGRGSRDEVSEDGEGRSLPGLAATDTFGAAPTSNIQRSGSVVSDIGYVLALNGSSLDQRNEPTIPGMNGSDTPSVSASTSRLGRTLGDRESLSLSEAVFPQFCTVQSRLATFGKWPRAMADTFPAQYMADQGFYYAGYADCVRCFYCGVGLKSWEPEDDPETEHIRWRPQCGFVRATRGTQFVHRTLLRINGTSEAEAEGTTSSSGSRSGGLSGASGGASAEGGPGSPGAEGIAGAVQQMITMGFSRKDIDAARVQLSPIAGLPENTDHLQPALLRTVNMYP
ncbi:hypothetical protein ACOMHN_043197 [Nucella lapillus]